MVVGFGGVQRSCKEGTILSFPPPLWGRGREGGSHELRPRLGLPLSPTLPHKGGGSERPVPPSRAQIPSKFPNDSNAILLCMGLFSHFLIGRPA
ncbi:hypothetical protein TM239_37920 [Bradyrhizobium sp. TM239]|nr:hypothetical protein TM239_37920 [Bradyrhizobium sp. TM239]